MPTERTLAVRAVLLDTVSELLAVCSKISLLLFFTTIDPMAFARRRLSLAPPSCARAASPLRGAVRMRTYVRA